MLKKENKMANEYFNKFDHITHKPLQIYNRVVLFSNILEEDGEDMAEQYFYIFSDVERKEMYIMQRMIRALGKDVVQKEVTKDLEITYDPSEDYSNV